MAGALASLTLALACLSAVATAREDPFVQEKTYAPPYGSGGSPATPTPDVPYSPSPVVPTPDAPYSPSPVVPTPDVPYTPPYSPTPSGGSPVVPTPDVPYTPTPYTPADPAPATPASPAATTPGTCSWWSKNTSSFPDIISIFTTLLDVFSSISGGSGGLPSIGSIFGDQMTVFQGLTNTRSDGYGALARQGSAAILNAYANPRQYPYSAQQVRLQFKNALGNQQTAFQMARVFENANNALGMRH